MDAKKQIITYTSTIAALLLLIFSLAQLNETRTVRIPILMYHHLADAGDPGSTISPEMFESHMKALIDAGYSSVSFEDLRDYVLGGAPLPDRPVVITFDDGYKSVYDSAFPILQKYSIKATVFIIGVLNGESRYKGIAKRPITPHLGDEEAREMAESGIFSIQSHSFDMHQLMPYESESPRAGILRKKGESRGEYIEALAEDIALASAQIENMVGVKPFAYSYPYGDRTIPAERVLKDMGISVTVTIYADYNTVIRNSPGSLRNLSRYNVPGDMAPEDLLAMINPSSLDPDPSRSPVP